MGSEMCIRDREVTMPLLAPLGIALAAGAVGTVGGIHLAGGTRDALRYVLIGAGIWVLWTYRGRIFN